MHKEPSHEFDYAAALRRLTSASVEDRRLRICHCPVLAGIVVGSQGSYVCELVRQKQLPCGGLNT